MKGVLVKDLYIARSNILVTIVSLVVLGFGLTFLLETSALLVLAPVAATTAAFISITSDAASKWNKKVITMPVSRNQIIGEKFFVLYSACRIGAAYCADSLYGPCVFRHGYNASLAITVWIYRDKRYPACGRHQPAVRILI